MWSVNHKIGVLEMIDIVDANSNVATLVIELTCNHQWNSELVTLITNRYTNVYHVEIYDHNS